MPESFQLEIVTPTKVIDCGLVDYLRAPSDDGLFGVLPGHTRAMISLAVGEIKVTAGGSDRFFATNGGYADIHPDSVQLLVETAEEASDIDSARAKAAAGRAEERVHDQAEGIDNARAEAALQRAVNRLSVAGRMG
ncbi:MAG: F0F1 ATP synthase subunit epsilon [Candidatus Marinimicrobia bacterium]|nr:F0F1 ATP synthase subunit epsilon [Candidatus Neomarinimicrobiota bacterium]